MPTPPIWRCLAGSMPFYGRKSRKMVASWTWGPHYLGSASYHILSPTKDFGDCFKLLMSWGLQCSQSAVGQSGLRSAADCKGLDLSRCGIHLRNGSDLTCPLSKRELYHSNLQADIKPTQSSRLPQGPKFLKDEDRLKSLLACAGLSLNQVGIKAPFDNLHKPACRMRTRRAWGCPKLTP